MSEKSELVHKIGGILLRRANAEGDPWDYCGWVFETTDGRNYGGELYRFNDAHRLLISLSDEQREASQAMFRFRDVTQVEGDAPWIKCNTGIRRSDKKIRMQFEFEDGSRWKITPANTENGFHVLLADLFPEDLKT